MRLWVLEHKRKGSKWTCWFTFNIKRDAEWSLEHSRRMYRDSEFRLVEYAPVRKAKK